MGWLSGRSRGIPTGLGVPRFLFRVIIQVDAISPGFPLTTKPRFKPVKKRNSRRPVVGNFTHLKRVTRPDFWALEMGLKVDGRPFTLDGREYVTQVMRDNSKRMVIPKAAQMAFTITFLVRTIHWMKERGWHHAYLLPLKTGAIPFVQGRFDPIVDSNEDLKAHFKAVDNRLQKMTVRDVKLYIRGTNINSELQEFPCDVEVWDERDRMVEDNLEDAKKRMSGSEIRILTELSTPTVPGHGVDYEDAWPNSDQHEWEIPCPACSRFQVLRFEENIKLGNTAEETVCECSNPKCRHAFTDLERRQANAFGRWVPNQLGARLRGYHISQLNSPNLPLEEVMNSWFVGQRDAKKLQTFWNGSMGIPYVAHGNQITPDILDSAIMPGHKLRGMHTGAVYIGVDVGTVLHMKSSFMDRAGRRVAWDMRTFADTPGESMWNKLDKFLANLNSFTCVIDAHPEKTKAVELAMKYHGRVFVGFEKDRPDQPEVAEFRKEQFGSPGEVVIDRTMAFDTTIAQYMNGKVVLPFDAREIGELHPRLPYNGFYHQMIQQKRIEEEDSKGRIVARWFKTKNPDHWHHADMFEFIATLKKPKLIIPAGISEAFDRGGNLIGS